MNRIQAPSIAALAHEIVPRPQTLAVGRTVAEIMIGRGLAADIGLVETFCYIGHGWSLAICDEPLIGEIFTVRHGRASLMSFLALDDRFGSRILTPDSLDEAFGPETDRVSADDRKLLTGVVIGFGRFSPGVIRGMARPAGGAIDQALARLSVYLPDEAIQQDFLRIACAA